MVWGVEVKWELKLMKSRNGDGRCRGRAGLLLE
jgi:hypothetical protein